MSSDKKKARAQKIYEKPRIRVIELSADEVLAVGCKRSTAGQTAQLNNLTNRCTLPTVCYNTGS